MQEIVMQLLLWLIVIGAFLVQQLFSRATESKLRSNIIFLFRSIMWRAGVVGIYYLLVDFGFDIESYHPMIRIASNIPLCFAISRFYFYIRREVRGVNCIYLKYYL